MPCRTARPYSRLGSLLLAAVSSLILSIAHAADPQPYAVSIAPTGNDALDAALKGSSQLESLRRSAPVEPFALVGRAQQDVERLQTVLQGFGYYQGRITITIGGRPLGDPELSAAIEALPKETEAAVAVAMDTGPLYHLRKVTIEGEIPEEIHGKAGIASGDPAVAAEVLNAQQRLLTALQEDGYALATVDAPVAYEDPSAQVLDVTLTVHAGPRVNIGEITISGLQEVNESIVRGRLLVHTGERYSPSKIEKARQDLLSLGVFSGVTVKAADQLDALGRIALTFDAHERLRHAVGFTAAYSTDLGGSVGATWRSASARPRPMTKRAATSSGGGRSRSRHAC